MITVKDETLKLLHKEIREDMDAQSNNVLDGVCEDYAQYQFYTGLLRGLGRAEDALLRIDEMMHRGDEDDD